MTRLLAILPALLFCSLGFAETGEVPMETVGTGGIIAFFVVCIAMVVAFVYLTNKSSKKSAEEKAGDKLK
jgi:hypothetical protein